MQRLERSKLIQLVDILGNINQKTFLKKLLNFGLEVLKTTKQFTYPKICPSTSGAGLTKPCFVCPTNWVLKEIY